MKLAWLCLADDYVSRDLRFLITKIEVDGRCRWALYGRVSGSPWSWTPRPLHVPKPNTKRACQEWAAQSGYEVPPEADPVGKYVESLRAAAGKSTAVGCPACGDKPLSYYHCIECGVGYDRPADHPTGDFCGSHCLEIARERIEEIAASRRTGASQRTRPEHVNAQVRPSGQRGGGAQPSNTV